MHTQSALRDVSRILAHRLAVDEPAHHGGKPLDAVSMKAGKGGARHEQRMADAERLVAVNIGLVPAAPGGSVVAEQLKIDLTVRAGAVEEQPADQARNRR